MDVVWYDESNPLEEMYSVNMQSSLGKSSQQPQVAIIYKIIILQFWLLVNDVQGCVIECQKHNQVKCLRTKYNKVWILKYVTYSHIIYHAYYSKHHNQPAYYSSNVKTYYMLDFNDFFCMRKNAENTGKHGKHTVEKHGKYVENCGF